MKVSFLKNFYNWDEKIKKGAGLPIVKQKQLATTPLVANSGAKG
ncbi:MAG TPA: hypothetical protein VGA67_01100 [Candidatus Dojkabacteria bacterium]|jgi:hypothetical protein